MLDGGGHTHANAGAENTQSQLARAAECLAPQAGVACYPRNTHFAPARKGGGTNGILVPPDLPQPFPPLLGPDSFRRHLSQAALFGFSLAICYSQGMAFDLDTVEDLKACEYIEPGFLERMTTGDGRIEK